MIVLHYSGLYPERVSHAVSIEGIGFPPGHRCTMPLQNGCATGSKRCAMSRRARPKSYPDLDAAVARMKEANPRFDEVARHLTLHGTNWNADGSMTWKFDNYLRALSPYGHDIGEATEIFSHIACPDCSFGDWRAFAPLPAGDPRVEAIPNCRLITVPNAGHWLHHDDRELFLKNPPHFSRNSWRTCSLAFALTSEGLQNWTLNDWSAPRHRIA